VTRRKTTTAAAVPGGHAKSPGGWAALSGHKWGYQAGVSRPFATTRRR
jgi:hypothetical protein